MYVYKIYIKAVEARGSQMANGISSSFYVIVGIKAAAPASNIISDPHSKFFRRSAIKSDKALRVFRCQFLVRYNKPSAAALSINVSGSLFSICAPRVMDTSFICLAIIYSSIQQQPSTLLLCECVTATPILSRLGYCQLAGSLAVCTNPAFD